MHVRTMSQATGNTDVHQRLLAQHTGKVCIYMHLIQADWYIYNMFATM